MLNKPKFLSPSVNMYGNAVIDLNSDSLPFSCIVDGNEAITDFQIVISRLKDNTVVFDTGMRFQRIPALSREPNPNLYKWQKKALYRKPFLFADFRYEKTLIRCPNQRLRRRVL